MEAPDYPLIGCAYSTNTPLGLQTCITVSARMFEYKSQKYKMSSCVPNYAVLKKNG